MTSELGQRVESKGQLSQADQCALGECARRAALLAGNQPDSSALQSQ
jgi:hypothetical protein